MGVMQNNFLKLTKRRVISLYPANFICTTAYPASATVTNINAYIIFSYIMFNNLYYDKKYKKTKSGNWLSEFKGSISIISVPFGGMKK